MKFLSQKNILLISPEGWGKSKVSKHHYAIIAGKFGNKVWFLSPESLVDQTQEKIPAHITLVPDHYQFQGLRWMPDFLRKQVMRQLIKKMQTDLNTRFDVVWNFDNSRFYDLDCFDVQVTIHHCMDYHYNFQLERASRSADVCFGVNDSIVSGMKKFNQHSYFIQHGYPPTPISNYSLPPSKESTRAVFAGNFMRKGIAWDWLEQGALACTQIHFYFVGNCGKNHLSRQIDTQINSRIEKISQFPNVTFVGELNESDAWTAMCESDILFGAFHADLHPEIFANPHKLLPYLATGKPIVINRIMQYESSPDLLLMAHNAQEFVLHFKKLLDKPDNQFGEAIRKKRISFAEDNTYEKQFWRIDQIIAGIL